MTTTIITIIAIIIKSIIIMVTIMITMIKSITENQSSQTLLKRSGTPSERYSRQTFPVLSEINF